MNNCDHWFVNDVCARCGKRKPVYGSLERMPQPGDASGK